MVVVLPVARAGVVRRVYIDAVHLSFASVKKELQGVIVLAIDNGVIRTALALLNLSN